MKLNYHPETDSLYIDLSGRPSSESKEFPKGNSLTMIEWQTGRMILHKACYKVELKLILNKLLPVETVAA